MKFAAAEVSLAIVDLRALFMIYSRSASVKQDTDVRLKPDLR